MTQEDKDEYYFLTERFDEITLALEGKCNDIDCDKYIYKDLLKKKYKPVLKHKFSCIESLKRDKAAIMRLLSNKKYKKYRFEKCSVCKKEIDKLNEKSVIVSFTRPSKINSKYTQWEGVWAHKICSSKIKIPKGWKKFR